jgi:hypothetical protein
LKEVVLNFFKKIGEIVSTLPTISKNSWSVFEENNRLKDHSCMQSHYVHCKRFWSSHANGLNKNREQDVILRHTYRYGRGDSPRILQRQLPEIWDVVEAVGRTRQDYVLGRSDQGQNCHQLNVIVSLCHACLGLRLLVFFTFVQIIWVALLVECSTCVVFVQINNCKSVT